MNARTMIGAGVAALGALGGVTVSIIGNIMDVEMLPPAVACPHGWTVRQCAEFIVPARDWHPSGFAIFWAWFVPLTVAAVSALLEVIPWPDGRRWLWVRVAGFVPVAGIAAVISYSHLRNLLLVSEPAWAATAGAALMDSLMVICTGALMAIAESVRDAAELPAVQQSPIPAPVVPAAVPTAPPEPAHHESPTAVPPSGLHLAYAADGEDVQRAAEVIAATIRRTGTAPSLRSVKADHGMGAEKAKRALVLAQEQTATAQERTAR